jgi:hypothetical protein
MRVLEAAAAVEREKALAGEREVDHQHRAGPAGRPSVTVSCMWLMRESGKSET